MAVRPRRRARAGFSLVELVVAVALMAVLAAVAYPGYRGALQKSRRTDAMAALWRVQALQERHRADHAAYATLAGLGLPPVTVDGHYRLEILGAGPSGYEALASARGTQAGDAPCRHFKLVVARDDVHEASGPDPTTGNADADNRRCWGR